MSHKVTLSALALVLATAAAAAFAAKGEAHNDALAATQAKVSLVQAIAAAEQHAGGTAVKAEFEHDRKGARYEVEVVKERQVFDVKVDADQGTVLSSVQDRND